MISAFFYLYIFAQSAGIEALYLYFVSKNKDFALKYFLFNSLTHPIVVFYFLADGRFSYLSGIIYGESFAVISEAILLYFFLEKKNFHQWLGISLIANLISWQIAPMLSYLIFVKLF